jgi:hypothetical protein
MPSQLQRENAYKCCCFSAKATRTSRGRTTQKNEKQNSSHEMSTEEARASTNIGKGIQ